MTAKQSTGAYTAILLADLSRSGVTDVVLDAGYDWSCGLTQPTQKSQNTQPIIHTKVRAALPQKSIKRPASLRAKDWIWSVGSGEGLVVLTAAEYTADRARHPMNEDEYTLFENMLLAAGMAVSNISWLCVAAADANGVYVSADHFAQLSPHVMSKLEDLKPSSVVVLGQVAASMLTGMETSLGEAREAEALYASSPIGVTYHPRTLLKQPLLKHLAWQDMQEFMKELTK